MRNLHVLYLTLLLLAAAPLHADGQRVIIPKNPSPSNPIIIQNYYDPEGLYDDYFHPGFPDTTKEQDDLYDSYHSK